MKNVFFISAAKNVMLVTLLLVKCSGEFHTVHSRNCLERQQSMTTPMLLSTREKLLMTGQGLLVVEAGRVECDNDDDL